MPIDQTDIFCKGCGADQRPPPQQPQQPVIPNNQVGILPVSPNQYLPQSTPQSEFMLNEMARQYKNLTWLAFIGIFLIPAFLLGLILVVYSMVQKPAFRRKVAEMGYDPEIWEAPLRSHSSMVFIFGLSIFAVSAIIAVKILVK